MQAKHIVLCSTSPRRHLLLKELGFSFEVELNDVDEDFPSYLKDGDVAIYLAEKKEMAIRDKFKPETIYITADTIVCYQDEVLGKPVDAQEAVSMLNKLSGNEHKVFTAVCLSSLEQKEIICVKSDVIFNELKIDEIMNYVERFKPFDKAGSYGAQECIQEGIDPCSSEEKLFLISIGKPDLFERTFTKNQEHVPFIKHIEGSYFNVMGLPIVELQRMIHKLYPGMTS